MLRSCSYYLGHILVVAIGGQFVPVFAIAYGVNQSVTSELRALPALHALAMPKLA